MGRVREGLLAGMVMTKKVPEPVACPERGNLKITECPPYYGAAGMGRDREGLLAGMVMTKKWLRQSFALSAAISK
jgi:hypothetical protein